MGIVSMFSNACHVHWIVFKLQVMVLCLFYAIVYYVLCCRPLSPRVLLCLVLKSFVRCRGIVGGGGGCCGDISGCTVLGMAKWGGIEH